MIKFEAIRHIEIDESFQGINLTEFSFNSAGIFNNDQIVDTFIRTKHFTYESLRDCVKREPDKEWLRQAFIIERIEMNDFKRYSKEGTIKYLFDFINEPDWSEDRLYFIKLVNEYFNILNRSGCSDFYILSKDWFREEDRKVIEPESWIYNYYFLIISVDRISKLLIFTEWTYE